MPNLLEGEVAAITGSGSGIGEGIALGYAAEGAAVALLDANGAAAEATAEKVRAAGGKAIAVQMDVTDRQACDAAAAKVQAELGGISILVNNAGINRRTPMTGDATTVRQDWDDIISINVMGVFNVTHAFMDQLRASKGRVVNIGSIQSFAHVRWPNSAAYTTSKHGVLGFTRALAAELGPEGIRVNAIGPGMIATPLNEATRASNPAVIERVLDHTPLGRIGEPKDIVGPAIFLASDLASYVTGGIVMADGGFNSV